jgi:hypothetical protein
MDDVASWLNGGKAKDYQTRKYVLKSAEINPE